MTMKRPQGEVPKSAQIWLQTVLGEYHILTSHRVGSSRTGVWQLQCSSRRYFFKLHYNRLVWHSEVYAYQHWAVAYEPYVPGLFAIFEDEMHQGLLVTAIPGVPLKDSQLDEVTITKVYEHAGRLCKRLHELPAGANFGLVNEQRVSVNYQGVSLGVDALDPVAFIQNDLIELFNQAQVLDCIEADELRQLEEALHTIDVFGLETPTVVNTDYTAGNWLVDQKGNFVGIIDLEHVFPNVMMDAFTRLIVADYPRGARAFFDGFGSNPLLARLEQARILCLRHALYYVSYGTKLNNKQWIKRGKAIFSRIDTLIEACIQ